MDQKTVFISYRRSLSKHLARSIYMDLRTNGWDVFFDVKSIDSGDFDKIILNQIGVRAHFILLISPDSLVRCANEGDWVLCEIREAVRLERNIVPIVEEGANFSREMSHLPNDLRVNISKKNALSLPNDYFDEGMHKLRTRFLKTPEYIKIIEGSTDEYEIRKQQILDEIRMNREMARTTMNAVDRAMLEQQHTFLTREYKRIIGTLDASLPSSTEILPAPFAWIDIPRKGYSIAKYPITTSQFAKFIDADGYNQKKWWTDAGWYQRQNDQWTQPLFWTDVRFNGAEQPVVGVSWHECIAFCRWLSNASGENIMLPTENQWQYAAQGDDGREYPWGKQWDYNNCNNNVEGKGTGKLTPVWQYEGIGNSPFNVVDMAGNVWEWCLTDYESKSNQINSNFVTRVLRGGSWGGYGFRVDFRCDNREKDKPYTRAEYYGFRISRT